VTRAQGDCRGVNKTKVKSRSSAANINLTKPKFNSDPELTVRNLALPQQPHIYNASTGNHNNMQISRNANELQLKSSRKEKQKTQHNFIRLQMMPCIVFLLVVYQLTRKVICVHLQWLWVCALTIVGRMATAP